MLICKLYWAEVLKFLGRFETENSFATVCSEQEADFVTNDEVPVFFKYTTYTNEAINNIMSQATKWQIKCRITEDWDPSFGYTQGSTADGFYQNVEVKQILVDNGNFAGVVACSRDLGDRYGIFSALTANYKADPLLFSVWDTYGSSDHDMTQQKQLYLVKKSLE